MILSEQLPMNSDTFQSQRFLPRFLGKEAELHTSNWCAKI